MINTLIPQMIGIQNLSLRETVDLAASAGFRGVSFDLEEAKAIVDADGLPALRAIFDDAGVVPAAWSPMVDWQNDATRDAQIERMKPLWEIGVALGVTNVTTGIMPANNDRPYDEQYEWMQTRLRPLAEALDAIGVRIGIEFISPKTLRDQFTYEFIYTMNDMLAFAKDIGTSNVGVLFDVWHHYCAHGTLDALDILTADDVQLIHTNDAPTGLAIDEQQDLSRTLPMETGVIPAPDYLRKLYQVGYRGAVAAEPFSARINELAARDPLAAARETCEAQRRLFAAAGIDA